MPELIVGLTGFVPSDIRVLSRLIQLTHSDDCRYQYKVAEFIDEAQIIIVNQDDQQSAVYRDTVDQQKSKIQIIYASSTPFDDTLGNRVGLPLRVIPVYEALNNAAESSLGITNSVTEVSLGIDLAGRDKPSGAHTAMVVDDSLPVRQSLVEDLQSLGFEIDAFDNGEQVLEAIRRSTDYSLVLLDVVLPGIDGYEVCRNIRQQEGLKQVPIIMLTGKSSMFDRVRGSLAGCDDYLMKPVDRSQLEALANKHVVDFIRERYPT